MFQALAADINSATQIELSQLQQSFPQQKQKRLELVSSLMSFNYQTAEHTRRKLIENVLQLPWSLQNYILTILRACTLSTPVHDTIQRGKAQHSTLCSTWWFIESHYFALFIYTSYSKWKPVMNKRKIQEKLLLIEIYVTSENGDFRPLFTTVYCKHFWT